MGLGDHCSWKHQSSSLLLGSLQVIEPVRSRCLCIRVAAPTVEGVGHLLDHVADNENLALPDGLRQRIAQGEHALGAPAADGATVLPPPSGCADPCVSERLPGTCWSSPWYAHAQPLLCTTYHCESNSKATAETQHLRSASRAWVQSLAAAVLPAPCLPRSPAGSDRNLRRALLALECCKVQQYPFSGDQQPPALDWELYVQVRPLLCCPLIHSFAQGAVVSVNGGVHSVQPAATHARAQPVWRLLQAQC